MIAFLCYNRQIDQSLKLEHLLRKVLVHIPHIDHEAELIRMWFGNHTDGAHHRRAMASRKAGESTRFDHLFDGVVHKLLMLECGWGVRGLFCCRSRSLPRHPIAVINPIQYNSTLDECAPKRGTLLYRAQGQWLRARRLERDIVFPIDVITNMQWDCFMSSKDKRNPRKS